MISNVGSEFQLKPVNFFSALASLDVSDSDEFEPCVPWQGNDLFDYTWSAEGNNSQYSKGALTLAESLPRSTPKSAGEPESAG